MIYNVSNGIKLPYNQPSWRYLYSLHSYRLTAHGDGSIWWFISSAGTSHWTEAPVHRQQPCWCRDGRTTQIFVSVVFVFRFRGVPVTRFFWPMSVNVLAAPGGSGRGNAWKMETRNTQSTSRTSSVHLVKVSHHHCLGSSASLMRLSTNITAARSNL